MLVGLAAFYGRLKLYGLTVVLMFSVLFIWDLFVLCRKVLTVPEC